MNSITLKNQSQNLRTFYSLLFITLLSLSACRGEHAWYEVRTADLCKDDPTHVASLYENTYERYEPYNIVHRESTGYESVDFEFIAECCLEFSGEAKVEYGLLTLKFWNTKEKRPCDCICDYKMTFAMETIYDWKKVQIEYIIK